MANKKEIAKPVERFKFSSRVDIIVPFHGQYEKVTRLIESVLRFTLSNVYQLILVDDASPNHVFSEDLAKIPSIQCVRLEDQRGFGGAMLAGFLKSEELNQLRREKNQPEHPYIVFVQSDCLFEDLNWLKSLGETMLDLKLQGVRMVGAKTNNPMTGDLRQKGLKGEIGEDIILDKTSLAMHCFMVHRELFKHVGGFIKNYKFGGYEDEEFAYRMRKHGFKQAISSRSWVKHAGGATFKSIYRNYEFRKTLEENRLQAIKDIKSL